MNYKEIANMPTSLDRDEISNGASGWHESLLRSYHIVKKVRWLLEQGSSSAVILELMDMMESDELQPYGWHRNKYHQDSQHNGPLGNCEKCKPTEA